MDKDISIGPLTDGRVYRYELRKKEWYDKEGPVDFLPFEHDSGPRRAMFYFDTESHKWLDEHFMILPIEKSVNIDCDFRKQYGLNGEAMLFIP